jgi:uncharacterized membrane protein YoaK (UPF0700 family)
MHEIDWLRTTIFLSGFFVFFIMGGVTSALFADALEIEWHSEEQPLIALSFIMWPMALPLALAILTYQRVRAKMSKDDRW